MKGAPVAQQVKVILVDDIDGGQAEETVKFAIDGASYEIDLNEANAEKLRDALAPFVGAARKASRSNGGRGSRRGGSGERRGRAADIREWARTKSIEVSERGRIPARVVEMYEAAH